MAVLEICTYPDPVLRKTAEDVERVDREISRLIDDMAETMYEAPGIGLAANQVGIPLRLVVIDLQKPELQQGLIVLVNPRIVAARGEASIEEGCLSVPAYFANVKRFEEVTVQCMDRNEVPIQIQASGLLAIALQHEIDHLQGKLFIDHLGPISKDIFKRKWKRKLKEAKA